MNSFTGVGRRGFMEFLGVGAATISGGVAQLDVASVRDSEDYDAYGVLLGPADARPSADGVYLGQYDTYQFLYRESDTGTEWVIDDEADAWALLPGSRSRLIDVLDTDQTVTNTIEETTVFDPEVESNKLFSSDVYSLYTSGTYTTTNSSEQFTLRFHLGDTEVASVTSVEENVSQAPWYAELTATIRSTGQSGVAKPHVLSAFNNVHDDQHSGTVVVDTTVVEPFTVTVQWDEANPDNEVKVGQAYLKRLGTAD